MFNDDCFKNSEVLCDIQCGLLFGTLIIIIMFLSFFHDQRNRVDEGRDFVTELCLNMVDEKHIFLLCVLSENKTLK